MDGIFPAIGKLRIPVSGLVLTSVPHSLLSQCLPVVEVPDFIALSVDSYFRGRAPSQMSGNPEGPRGQEPSAWQRLQYLPFGAHHTLC